MTWLIWRGNDEGSPKAATTEDDEADDETDTEADISLLSGKQSNQTTQKTLENTTGGRCLPCSGNIGTAISSGADGFYTNKWWKNMVPLTFLSPAFCWWTLRKKPRYRAIRHVKELQQRQANCINRGAA
jgi:hypothetical protein